MPAGFRRHLVGKTLRNVRYSAVNLGPLTPYITPSYTHNRTSYQSLEFFGRRVCFCSFCEQFQTKIAKVTHRWVISKAVQVYMAPRAEPDLWGLWRPKLVKIHEGGTRQETNASARPTYQAQCIVQQLNN